MSECSDGGECKKIVRENGCLLYAILNFTNSETLFGDVVSELLDLFFVSFLKVFCIWCIN